MTMGVSQTGGTVAAVRTFTAQQKGSSLHVFLTSACVFSRNLGVICSVRGCLSLCVSPARSCQLVQFVTGPSQHTVVAVRHLQS